MKTAAVVLMVPWVFAVACGQKHLPPGTPAPEYEAPVVTPWPPDAGSSEPETPPESPAAPAVDDDAGTTDAGPSHAEPPALLDGGVPEAG